MGTTGTFTIDVFETPIISLASSALSPICEGDAVTFTGTDALVIADNYAFIVNGITVQSSISPTYTTSTLSDGDNIIVTATAGGTCPVSSSPAINFTVDPLPLIFNVQ